MAYQSLDQNSVIDFLRTRPAMKDFFAKGYDLKAREVGDGNLNLVFFVTNAADETEGVVVKQAVPYLRVAGDSWPLTLERMRFETQALRLQGELAPGLVPAVYDDDQEMSLVVMEYLGKHEIMRKPLVHRVRFPRFVDHITTFMARTLFLTSDMHLEGIKKKELQAKFINPHLCKMQEDFVFTNPYMQSDENHWNPLVDGEVQAVRRNGALKVRIGEMKEKYMTQAQCLIHNDLHTGSIMLNQEDTRVIDPEFAFFGPMGHDIAAVLQNLTLNYLSHFAHTPDPAERADYQAYLLDTIEHIWLEFERKFEALWLAENTGELMQSKYWDFAGGQQAWAEFRARYVQRLFQDVVGFSGCKILRRMMGIVTVWDISSIEDPVKRAEVERMAIRIGTRWLMEKESIHSISDYLGIVKEESAGIAK